MIKTLDRYLLRNFISSLIIITLGFGILIIAINMVEELRDFIDHDVPLVEIFIYYIYFAGWILKSFLPVFVLLAALTSIGMLARKNEILAMKAGGISLYRIAAPILIFTFFLSIFHIYYNEYFYPPGNKKRVEMKEYTIKKVSPKANLSVHNIYRQVNKDIFFVIQGYDIPKKEGVGVKIYRSKDDKLTEMISAEKIQYTLSAAYIKDKPSDFEKPLENPEDMGYNELKHYIDVMKRTGAPYQRELVDLRFKLSYPFASFIVILICVPIASNPKRGGIAISFAVGSGIAILYFVCFKIIQSLGYSEKLSPDLAAWLINGVFLLVGLVIMLRARK